MPCSPSIGLFLYVQRNIGLVALFNSQIPQASVLVTVVFGAWALACFSFFQFKFRFKNLNSKNFCMRVCLSAHSWWGITASSSVLLPCLLFHLWLGSHDLSAGVSAVSIKVWGYDLLMCGAPCRTKRGAALRTDIWLHRQTDRKKGGGGGICPFMSWGPGSGKTLIDTRSNQEVEAFLLCDHFFNERFKWSWLSLIKIIIHCRESYLRINKTVPDVLVKKRLCRFLWLF